MRRTHSELSAYDGLKATGRETVRETGKGPLVKRLAESLADRLRGEAGKRYQQEESVKDSRTQVSGEPSVIGVK